MTKRNYVERTHTETSIEFGAYSVSLNRDNQTRDFSVTACLSGGVSFGRIFVIGYDENAAGGTTSSIDASIDLTDYAAIGLGPGIKGSKSLLFNNPIEITQSVPNESMYSAFGGEVGRSLEGCIEVNPRGLVEGAEKFLRSLMEKPLDKSTEDFQFGENSSNDEGEFGLFERKETQYHLIDPKEFNSDNNLKDTNTDLGELSNKSLL